MTMRLRPFSLLLQAMLLAAALAGCDGGSNATRNVDGGPLSGDETESDDDGPVTSEPYTLTLNVAGLPPGARLPVFLNDASAAETGDGAIGLTVRAGDVVALGRPVFTQPQTALIDCGFDVESGNGVLVDGALRLRSTQDAAQAVNCGQTYLVRMKHSRYQGSTIYTNEGWLRINASSRQAGWLVDRDGQDVMSVYKGSNITAERQDIAFLGDRVVFSAVTAEHGRELWVSDGTAAGTHLLKDILEGTNESNPRNFVGTGNGKAYFYAMTAGGRFQLHETDGTAEGTRHVPVAGLEDENYGISKVAVNGKLLFVANNQQVYVLDDAGARLLREFDSAFSTNPPFHVLGDRVIFAMDGGNALWVSDGTDGGTRQLGLGIPFQPGVHYAVSNGVMYFNGYDTAHGWEPWRTDGTEEGTYRVQDIIPGVYPNADYRLGDTVSADFSRLGYYTSVRDGAYFVATDFENGSQVWKITQSTDGSPDRAALTRKVIHVDPSAVNAGPGRPTDLYGAGTRLIFQASDTNAQWADIWISDGTAAGTQQLFPNGDPRWEATRNRRDMTRLGSDSVIFIDSQYSSGLERYWISDATTDGTVRLKNASGKSFEVRY